MPIPSSVEDLDPAAANNSPGGSEPIGPNLDGYLRAYAAIIRQVSDKASVAATADIQLQKVTAFTSTGIAPNFTVTPVPALTAYTAGQRLRVKFHAAGSGGNTLNVSALGAKSLKQYNAAGAKVPAVIAAGQLADVEYDGVDFVILDPLPESLPAGLVVHFAASAPPTGWLKANGAAISRTTYAALFAAIGTTFGAGDGSTTFNVPDLRGEFVRGWDDGRGVDSGRALGSAQAATRLPNLSVYASSATAGVLVSPAMSAYGGSYPGDNFQKEADSIEMTTAGNYLSVALSVAGGTTTGKYYTARPRNVALLACIKY